MTLAIKEKSMRISNYILVPAYIIFGPPLGALAFWAMPLLPAALFETMKNGIDAPAWAGGFKLLGIYSQFSYLLGFFAAFGAGMIHAVGRHRHWSSKVLLSTLALAGAASTAALVLFGANSKYMTLLPFSWIAAGGISSPAYGFTA